MRLEKQKNYIPYLSEKDFLEDLILFSTYKVEKMSTSQENKSSYGEYLIEFDRGMIEEYYFKKIKNGEDISKAYIFKKIEEHKLSFEVFEKMLSNIMTETKSNVSSIFQNKGSEFISQVFENLFSLVKNNTLRRIKNILFSIKTEMSTINCYPEDFLDYNFLSLIKGYSRGKASKIAIEIKETQIPEGKEEQFSKNIQLAQAYGYKIGIDDFRPKNTINGHSGNINNHSEDILNYFKENNIQLDFIKIDGPYFKEIVEHKNQGALEKLIFKIAAEYNIKVFMIEHIETQELHEAAQKLEKSFPHLNFYYQGYFFSPPINNETEDEQKKD